ncbi:ABC transporter substrate-binding protein [Aurantimonas sp. A2-1-M11]|uniref:heme/hemin ABC transporter substrate-binding protein n=1 Tax=Aurantimonas sp. A2-1-M11 TaxID=3113712 RepID=UPI002F9296F7
MTTISRRFQITATWLSLLPAMAGPAMADSHSVTDALGRTVEIADTSRIVSIGGAVTEILDALGMAENVVAVDTTSTYPAAMEDKPDVGYMRALAAEGILALDPSLIVAIEGAGPPAVLDVLEAASVPFVNIPDTPTPEGIAAKIRAVAAAVGRAEKGEELAAAVSADLAAITTGTASVERRLSVAFILAMRSGAPLVAGSATSADAMLSLAGADNAFAAFEGFKPATPEATVASAPDAVVTMASGEHADGLDRVRADPAFATTPAVRQDRLYAHDGTYLLGFGPRTAHAVRDLAADLYPDLDLPVLPPRPWVAPR